MAQKVPVWAFRLILRVCVECDADLPMVTWHKSKHSYSSGRTWPGRKMCRRGRIHVTAGRDSRDQRFVVLHELAHHLLPASEHHSERFFRLAFLLYQRHGVPLRYARKREADMKASESGYQHARAVAKGRPH